MFRGAFTMGSKSSDSTESTMGIEDEALPFGDDYDEQTTQVIVTANLSEKTEEELWSLIAAAVDAAADEEVARERRAEELYVLGNLATRELNERGLL